MEHDGFPPAAHGGNSEPVRPITTKTAGSFADAIAIKEPERRDEMPDGNHATGQLPPEPAQPESCLAAALAYAARGWHVLSTMYSIEEVKDAFSRGDPRITEM